MTRSMTGFGRAVGTVDGDNITIELSSVNHRYFDCSVRLPAPWITLEQPLREWVREKVNRGKISVSIRRDNGGNSTLQVKYDANIAQQYISASESLAQALYTPEARLSLDVLAQLEGVFYQEESKQDLELITNELQAIFNRALEQYQSGREREGEALKTDLLARLQLIEESIVAIENRRPEILEAYENRLRDRMQELNTEIGLSEDRIAMEVAMMAEKTDTHEELIRLQSHLEHGRALLDSKEAMGRDLNFLSQEIQREINTLGSKLRDIEVTREVLTMKSELEKLREQIQNIE